MDSGCRLCNSNLMLINLFEIPSQDSEQIKKCIEIATGLTIQYDDDMGKLVCKHCCDVAILCYKYRKNAQKNAIRIRDELRNIKNSNFSPTLTFRKPGPKCSQKTSQSPTLTFRKPGPKSSKELSQIPDIFRKPSPKSIKEQSQSPDTFRKPGPKSSKEISQSFRKPGPKCSQKPAPSHTKYNISPSTSQILLKYPSLRVPKQLYTENILPHVILKDVRLNHYIDRHGVVVLQNNSPKKYLNTNVNTTKVSLEKVKHRSRSSSVSSADWNDNDAGNISDASDVPISPKPFDSPSKDGSLLIPVTYKDEFVCNICNKLWRSAAKLKSHMQNRHKVIANSSDEDSSNAAPPAPSRRRTRKRKQPVPEDSDDSFSSNITSTTASSDVKYVPKKTLILRLTRFEDDEEIRRAYPEIIRTFNKSDNDDSISVLSDDNNDGAEQEEVEMPEPIQLFNPAWTKGIKAHEKQKVHNTFLDFLRMRIPDKPPPPPQKRVVELKHAEVQASTRLDAQFKLDGMGLNEMEVLLPELGVYNVPVSILKQAQNKEMTAFFIQYADAEAVTKPIDWSKLTATDLQRQMRDTSTPFSAIAENGETGSGNVSAASLPTLISLRDFRKE